MNSDRNFVRSLSEYLAFHTEQSSDHLSHLIDSFLQGRPPHSKPAQAEQNRLKGQLDAEIQAQNGVPSFLQTYLITHLHHGSWPPQASFVATRYLHRSGERFVSWDRRQSFIAELNGEPIRGTELGFRQLLYSQGAGSIFRWGSIPCFKAIYDLGIYAMLIAELQPGTLIELGSGTGGSAVFFADLCTSSGLTTEIVSVDRAPVEVSDPRVAFIQSDCAEWLSAAVKSKREFRRPCLLIEDFHGDLGGFFEQIDSILEVGDYLIIEDSSPKQNRISEVITNRPYLIDSKFTDLFGINCTSAINSIFVKQGDDGASSAPSRQDRQLLREQDRAWRRRNNR
jgi:cephalosporin hydroxylase